MIFYLFERQSYTAKGEIKSSSILLLTPHISAVPGMGQTTQETRASSVPLIRVQEPKHFGCPPLFSQAHWHIRTGSEVEPQKLKPVLIWDSGITRRNFAKYTATPGSELAFLVNSQVRHWLPVFKLESVNLCSVSDYSSP